MPTSIHPEQLIELGLTSKRAVEISQKVNEVLLTLPTESAWSFISKQILTPTDPFSLHRYIFSVIFPDWPMQPENAPAWLPDMNDFAKTNIASFMNELNLQTCDEFHRWSVIHFQRFWERMIGKLSITFQHKPTKICDLNAGLENPQWLPHAKLNIIDSCFNAMPEKIAIISQSENDPIIKQMTYGDLNQLSNRIANSLIKLGFHPGDRIAINMPMTPEAVAIYIAIIKMGAVVVSIADSFTPDEIATRLRITQTNAVFTQDSIFRNGKKLPLYEKVIKSRAPIAIILSDDNPDLVLRDGDIHWKQFLSNDDTPMTYPCDPMTHCNILFSSGTTNDPKAIPWTHITAIKAASDAYLHHNIQTDDILTWPTNLGWMMGPWLLFATLINQATLALYDGAPVERSFGKFIQDTKVTFLGVVPTIVANWRRTNCMYGLNWQSIKVFSSTGECSNPEDMLYLMYLANYKPIIEYCGGTEIGGAYVSSTVIEKNYPSLFTTPTMGLDFILIDEQGQSSDIGEVALIPPSIGLSTELLNGDHHKIYYANMPLLKDNILLRRHGDQLKRYENGLYCMLGRSDDTMNLGGIKVSSAEIERVLVGIDHINETAAIAISPTQGPSLLVIYAATTEFLNKEELKKQMQDKIRQHLNPLFKIHDVVFINTLPKTASNKIMRRVLRTQYLTNNANSG